MTTFESCNTHETNKQQTRHETTGTLFSIFNSLFLELQSVYLSQGRKLELYCHSSQHSSASLPSLIHLKCERQEIYANQTFYMACIPAHLWIKLNGSIKSQFSHSPFWTSTAKCKVTDPELKQNSFI